MSASNKPNTKEKTCGFCRRGVEVESTCGQLYTAPECTAHKKCMQYSALLIQYRTKEFGGFKKRKVVEEISRGKTLNCSICNSKRSKKKHQHPIRGATCGCAINICRRTFHFYCAHHDEKTICRRMEVQDKDSESNSVLYRVFCSSEHLEKFEKESALDISYNSESSADEYSSAGEEVSDKSIATPDDKGGGDSLDRNKKRISALPANVPSNKRSRSALDEKPPKNNQRLKYTPPISNEHTDTDDDSLTEHSDQSDTKTILSKKTEPLSDDQVEPDSEVILCIMEEGNLADKLCRNIRELISSKYKVKTPSIHFWSCQNQKKLASHQMLFFMRDVAKAVYYSNTNALERLILKSSADDFGEYTKHCKFTEDFMDEELLGLTRSRMHDVISVYLKSNKDGANDKQACKAFTVANGSLCIALPLNDHLDPKKIIYHRLPGRECVFPVSLDEELRQIKSCVNQEKLKECNGTELAALTVWLKSEIDGPLKIRVRPKELILRDATLKSNTCQLCNHFTCNTLLMSEGFGTTVMFILPVQSEIMMYGAYCRQAISAFVAEELLPDKPIYCMLDIDEMACFSCVFDVLPPLADNISIYAFTGLDSKIWPVSCVAIKFSFIP